MPPEREGLSRTTGYVLTHVESAKESLSGFRRDNLSADGVFIHSRMHLVALKVAREELDKAITLMERAKWRR